jgi:hypothetical protein
MTEVLALQELGGLLIDLWWVGRASENNELVFIELRRGFGDRKKVLVAALGHGSLTRWGRTYT